MLFERLGRLFKRLDTLFEKLQILRIGYII